MSENDSLCNSVATEYNEHYSELKFDHRSYIDTVRQPRDFKFLAPDQEFKYHADIFGDRKPRSIAKQIVWQGRAGYDEILIMRARNLADRGTGSTGPTAAVEMKISFSDPQRYWHTRERLNYYLLSKYPGGESIEIPPFPKPIVRGPEFLWGSYTNNLISFRSGTFGVARQTLYGLELKDGDIANGHQFILVYKVLPTHALDDVCYLEVRGRDYVKP